jgi:hypothetical protein
LMLAEARAARFGESAEGSLRGPNGGGVSEEAVGPGTFPGRVAGSVPLAACRRWRRIGRIGDMAKKNKSGKGNGSGNGGPMMHPWEFHQGPPSPEGPPPDEPRVMEEFHIDCQGRRRHFRLQEHHRSFMSSIDATEVIEGEPIGMRLVEHFNDELQMPPYYEIRRRIAERLATRDLVRDPETGGSRICTCASASPPRRRESWGGPGSPHRRGRSHLGGPREPLEHLRGLGAEDRDHGSGGGVEGRPSMRPSRSCFRSRLPPDLAHDQAPVIEAGAGATHQPDH